MQATPNIGLNKGHYQPVSTPELETQRNDDVQHHHRGRTPALLAVLPVLAVLTVLIPLKQYVPTYPDGVTDTKPGNQTGYGSVTIHGGLSVSDERLSAALLCRPNSSSIHEITMMYNWTTQECFDEQNGGPNVNVASAKSLMANNTLWVDCASQYNQSLLDIHDSPSKYDTFEPVSCPFYPEPNASDPRHVLLKVPMHDFNSNIFHQMAIRGRPLWCIFQAVTHFASQATCQNVTWTVEYKVDPGMHRSRYVERLFHSLSSHDDDSNNDTTALLNDPDIDMTPYELEGNLSLENTLVVAHGKFRPNTQFSPWLADISLQVRRQVLSGDNASHNIPKEPFVLFVPRATKKRRLAGAETGTATEIVLALRKRDLSVHVMDSAVASIEDQLKMFETATVVVSMHGAGLTNLIWMRPRESVVIEVAASYGWARYLDTNGTCAIMQGEPENYKKGGYYNLARRFGVKYELVHPVYASRPPDSPFNPVGKLVYYVDSDALADVAENAFNDMALQTKG